MTWLALRLLLRRVPGIAWVITGSVIVAALALWATYHAGAKHEAQHAHRAALADSTSQEDSVHETTITRTDHARQHTDNKRALARFATRTADSSRAAREKLRAEVEPMLKDAPLPLVQLVHMDDQQIRRDSAATETYLAVDTALVDERLASLAERTSAARLDTLHQHQAGVGLEPEKKGHGKLIAATVVVTVGAVKFGPAIVKALLHAVR
jgi:hypothetical protein